MKCWRMTIDVWMQHPTLRFLAHDMFDSLRRWTGAVIPSEEPDIAVTVGVMDAAGVEFGLLSAWTAPHQPPLISNEEVAGWVAEHPSRFAGLAAVDLNRPMEAVRELRRCIEEYGFKGLRVVPWLWEAPPNRPALLPAVRRLCRTRRAVLYPSRPHRPAPRIRDRAPDPIR
jgi:predicted TIM-barrel fold metal-dependent hydrolase